MADHCNVKNCKQRPIDQFIREQNEEVIQYVGIAVDEQGRADRLLTKKKQSLLVKYGYTERMAEDLCRKYDLLSPLYQSGKRSGCWFCPNASIGQLRSLRKDHPDLWGELLGLEQEENLAGALFDTRAKRSILKLDKQFALEEECGMVHRRGQIRGQYSLFKDLHP